MVNVTKQKRNVDEKCSLSLRQCSSLHGSRADLLTQIFWLGRFESSALRSSLGTPNDFRLVPESNKKNAWAARHLTKWSKNWTRDLVEMRALKVDP